MGPMEWRTLELATEDDQARTLWGVVQSATGDPRLRAELARIVRDAGVPARDPRALAAAVQQRVQRIKYLREVPDTFVHPARTLEWGIGDCDDMASLVCALLRTAAVPCRLTFLGWAPSTSPGPIALGHVYAEALVGGSWFPLEAVRPVPFGWSPEAYKRSQGQRTRTLFWGDYQCTPAPSSFSSPSSAPSPPAATRPPMPRW